jgi:O-antigen/teichoic acid export membrane protein
VTSTEIQKKSSFVKDVLKLVSGTTSAQALSILGAFVTTRFFAPSAFGVAVLFASITSMAAIVACMRYELSIILPKEDDEAANAAGVSLSFLVLTTAVLGGLVWAGGASLSRLLKAPELQHSLWLVPVSIFFGGFSAILNRWNSRKQQFMRLTVAQVVGAVCTVSLQIIFGLIGRATGGSLIVAAVLGTAVSTTTLAILTWREHSQLLLNAVRAHRLVAALKRYRRFPKFGAANALLDTVSWQLPVWFLSIAFYTAVVGQYALGIKLLHIPMNLVGTNVAIVFFQRAAAARHEGTLSEIVESTFRSLVTLSLLPCLVLSLIGRDVFVVFFGARWAQAGVYAQILSLWLCVWFASGPLSIVLDVLEQQALRLRLSLLNALTRAAALSAGLLTRDPLKMIGLFVFCAIIMYGYYCWVILKHSGVPLGKILPLVTTNLLCFIPMASVILILKYLAVPHIVVLITAGLMMGIYYLNILRTQPAVRGFLAARAGRSPNLQSSEQTLT